MLRFLAALALIPAVAIARVPAVTPVFGPLQPGDAAEWVRVPTNSVCAPFILPPNSCSSAHAGICTFLYPAAREQKPKWLSPPSKHGWTAPTTCVKMKKMQRKISREYAFSLHTRRWRLPNSGLSYEGELVSSKRSLMRFHQSQRRHELLMHYFSLLCPLIFFQRQQTEDGRVWNSVRPAYEMPGCFRDRPDDDRVFPEGGGRNDETMSPEVSAATQELA